MGNLGRAGYGATTDGLWPYTYDACDVGTLPNQTLNGQPIAATNTGNSPEDNYALSFLPGMRLSSCTCPGEAHPGPVHPDGTFVGRSAPEIDVVECEPWLMNRIVQHADEFDYSPSEHDYLAGRGLAVHSMGSVR